MFDVLRCSACCLIIHINLKRTTIFVIRYLRYRGYTWSLDYQDKSMVQSVLVNNDFLTWLLIGWHQAASQSEAMFENICQLAWILMEISNNTGPGKCPSQWETALHLLFVWDLDHIALHNTVYRDPDHVTDVLTNEIVFVSHLAHII